MTYSRIPVGETDGRLCAALNCRKPLVRHANEGHHHYNNRLCCGSQCVFRYASEKRGLVEIGEGDGRQCYCGELLIRREDELPNEFRRRRCCDSDCAVNMRRANMMRGWKAGNRTQFGNQDEWPELPSTAFANDITESPERQYARLIRPDATHVSGCGSSALVAAEHWGAKW